MGASAGKPPAAPDPNTILGLQNQYNRYNSVGPFGSQTWSSGGPGGHETETTNLDPRMSAAVDRAFSAAATPYQKEYIPTGMDQLASGVLGKVGSHYGLSGSGLNTNLQQQKPSQGSPQPPQGLPGGGMSGLGLQTQGSPMQGGLGQMGGAPQSGAMMGPPQQMGMPGMGGMGLGMQQPGPMGPPQQMGAPTMSGMGIGMQQPGGGNPFGNLMGMNTGTLDPGNGQSAMAALAGLRRG